MPIHPVATEGHLKALEPLRNLLPGWPSCLPAQVGDPIRPLVVGIDLALLVLTPGGSQATRNIIRRALGRYTRSQAYQVALKAPRARRYGLAGVPVARVVEVDHSKPVPKEITVSLTTKRAVVTIPLLAEELPGAADSTKTVRLNLKAGEVELTAEVSGKCYRRALRALTEHGTSRVTLVLRGVLAPGNLLEGASVMAQLKKEA